MSRKLVAPGWAAGLAHGEVGHGALTIIGKAMAFQSVTASARATEGIQSKMTRVGIRVHSFWRRGIESLLSQSDA